MVELAVATVSEVDLCYLLIDAPRALERLDKVTEDTRRIVGHLEAAKKKAFLVPNKVDKVADKRALLGLIEKFAALHPFAEVVPVSARSGVNVDALLKVTREHLPEGRPMFDADELTDRPVRYIAKEIIREQLFLTLAQELPYSIAVDVISWEEKGDGLVVIHANVHVARKSHKPIVVGRGASQIKTIGEKSRERIERLIERKVYLDLRVKVDEDWNERPDKLKALGYDELG
jgi:GTP-binding protein Era